MQAPVPTDKRTLGGFDFFLLWMGAGIALTEIWAGGLLAPMGLTAGLLAILLGHVIGNTPMALAGLIGSRHGVPSMVSTRAAMGMRGSYLPAVFNVVQLVGWTAVMLWIGGQAAASLMKDALPLPPAAWIAICGALTTLWTLAGHKLWKTLQVGAMTLLFALSVVMTWLVLKTHGLDTIAAVPATGTLGFGAGLDLVIAMPISWLPLAADYARFARCSRAAFAGTWIGYFIAGAWMYAVGLAVALATGSHTPDAMVMGLMASSGWLVGALLVVLVSTFTTTFLDIYSNAVSIQSLAPRIGERPLVLATGLAGTALALVFNPLQYESFLLLIGSIFCPLFGVVLADYFVVRKGRYDGEALFGGSLYWYQAGFHPRGVGAWLLGLATFHLASHLGSPVGASIPGMATGALAYMALCAARAPGLERKEA